MCTRRTLRQPREPCCESPRSVTYPEPDHRGSRRWIERLPPRCVSPPVATTPRFGNYDVLVLVADEYQGLSPSWEATCSSACFSSLVLDFAIACYLRRETRRAFWKARLTNAPSPSIVSAPPGGELAPSLCRTVGGRLHPTRLTSVRVVAKASPGRILRPALRANKSRLLTVRVCRQQSGVTCESRCFLHPGVGDHPISARFRRASIQDVVSAERSLRQNAYVEHFLGYARTRMPRPRDGVKRVCCDTTRRSLASSPRIHQGQIRLEPPLGLAWCSRSRASRLPELGQRSR